MLKNNLEISTYCKYIVSENKVLKELSDRFCVNVVIQETDTKTKYSIILTDYKLKNAMDMFPKIIHKNRIYLRELFLRKFDDIGPCFLQIKYQNTNIMMKNLHELENLKNSSTYTSFISFKDAGQYDISSLSKGYNPAENFIIVLSIYDSEYKSIFTVDVKENAQQVTI